MSTTFYKSVIEDEIKSFNIKEESLKVAAKSVSQAYSRNSLSKGHTFLDYNLPANRCAYIYKYSSLHSVLVNRYFAKLMCKAEVKTFLQKKETLKICCLGGGPGTDIVGLFKALASSSNYHKKVIEVTVLDICGGWRNSFKRIITNLINGKVKDVPATFINVSNFKFKLIEVDLLNNLPSNIVTILSEADIICMVKFVSAILGSSMSLSALQVIGSKLKVGAIVLFIDNLNGNVFKPFFDISQQNDFQLILGPIHKSFNTKNGYCKGPVTSKERKMFGCSPLNATAVTVLGFIKSDEIFKYILNNSSNMCPDLILDDNDGWDTDEDIDIIVKKRKRNPSKISYHKFSQTDKKCFDDSEISVSNRTDSVTTNVLYSLIDSLSNLFRVLTQFKQQTLNKNHFHHCH